MNGNSSKQVLLSVLGIAVLVVAVVGVSFAFFTYSKAGTQNNTLTTGSIFFNFTEGQAITLTNQFPISDSKGSTLSPSGGDNAVLTFNIVGYDGSGTGIDYTITANQGDPIAEKTRFKDSEIKLLLTAPDTATNNFETAKVVGADGSLATGVTLATGKITATDSDSQQTDTYTLRMWITEDVVSIDDNDTPADGDSVYTSTEFGNLYYSLRLKVDANTSGA